MRLRQLLPLPLLVGCATTPIPVPDHEGAAVLSGPAAVYVASVDPERPRLRYADGQLSGNDSCFILIGNKLNNKVPPLYVNGAPVGFC